MKTLRHPIRAIREPFGTAGLIVAVVALIAALGGSALAAKGALTGKQKKEVEKIAKKYAGKPGAPGATGPQGPAGAKGDTGAAGAAGKDGTTGKDGTNGTPGTDGTPGTNGKSVKLVNSAPPNCTAGGFTYEVEGSGSKNEVCNGAAAAGGGFPKELPEGETETGTWSYSGNEEGAVPISFPIPLSPADAASMKSVFKSGDSNFATECPGSLNEPEAEPGVLCVYLGTPGAKSFNGFYQADFTTEVSAAGMGTAGVIGYIETTTPDVSTGTWAVTAPLGS